MRDVRGPAAMLRQSGASAGKQRRAPVFCCILRGALPHFLPPPRIFCGQPHIFYRLPGFSTSSPTFSTASPDFLRAAPTFSIASPDFLRASPHFLPPPRIFYERPRIFCGTKIASVHTMRPRVFSLDPNRVSGMPHRSTHRLKQRPATKACRERLQCAATTRAETLEPPSFLHLFPISTPWPPHATVCCSLPS